MQPTVLKIPQNLSKLRCSIIPVFVPYRCICPGPAQGSPGSLGTNREHRRESLRARGQAPEASMERPRARGQTLKACRERPRARGQTLEASMEDSGARGQTLEASMESLRARGQASEASMESLRAPHRNREARKVSCCAAEDDRSLTRPGRDRGGFSPLSTHLLPQQVLQRQPCSANQKRGGRLTRQVFGL